LAPGCNTRTLPWRSSPTTTSTTASLSSTWHSSTRLTAEPTTGDPSHRVDHVAYTYASLTDLFDKYTELKAQGINPYWCIHHGITVSMYYGDPDGNQMEFQVDCFADNDDANAFMYRSFAVNPIGVEYDPDAWIADLETGTTPAELLTRTADLPVSPIRNARSAGFAVPAE